MVDWQLLDTGLGGHLGREVIGIVIMVKIMVMMTMQSMTPPLFQERSSVREEGGQDGSSLNWGGP